MSPDSPAKWTDATPLDDETLEDVRRRVPQALNTFFDHYFDRVYGYVATLVRGRDLAEDLTQEAFLRMHRAIDRLEPGRDPSPWVFTVTINTVRDYWRSRRHRDSEREVNLNGVGELPEPNNASGPERSLDQKEEAELVRRALDQLQPADREVIVLRNYEMLGTEEVSRLLDVSRDAIRQRHSRAVARLGKLYAELLGTSQGES